MADVKIRVIGEDQALDLLKNIDKNLEKMATTAKESTKKQKSSWTEIKSAIDLGVMSFNKVFNAAQKAYQFISEGADIELAETRFNRLAESIGTTGDALMKDLGPAVGGMLSQAGQMKLAGDLMSLGLAKTTDEAVRLTGVASQLGMDMNQLVLTLTNQTTMRFDALGVAVDGFDAKVKALEAQGYSTDEAFKWAFIQQAEAQIERVGSVADTTAGELMKLEAGLANLKDEAAKTAAEFAGPVISKLNDSRDALALLNDLFDKGAIGVGEYAKTQALLRTPLGDTEAILLGLQEKQDSYNRALERGYDISYRFTDATITGEGVIWSYANAAQAAAENSAYYGAVIRDNQSAQSLLNETLTAGGKAYSDISTNVYSLTQSLQDQLDFLTAGGGALLDLAQTAQQALDEGNFAGAQEALDAAAEGAVDLDLELGKIDPDEAVQRLMELGNGPEEAKAKVEEFQNSLFALTSANYAVYIDLITRGQLPRSGTGTAPGGGEIIPGTGGAYASGTNGWQTVPGAAGAPFPVTLHGGESFNVVPNGKSGGGDSPIFIDTIIVQDGSDFAAVLGSMIQNQNRNALSMRGGAGYAGT